MYLFILIFFYHDCIFINFYSNAVHTFPVYGTIKFYCIVLYCQRPRLILSTRQQSRRQCSASDQQNVIPVVNRTNSPSKRRLRSLTSVAALTCCRIASCHGTPTISLTVRRYVSLAGHKLNLPPEHLLR